MTLLKEETKISVLTVNELKRKKININLKIVNKAIYFLLFILCIYYVVGANDLTIKGFTLKDLKSGSRIFIDENKRLESEITYLRSYSNIEKSIVRIGMVKNDRMAYLDAGLEVVARK